MDFASGGGGLEKISWNNKLRMETTVTTSIRHFGKLDTFAKNWTGSVRQSHLMNSQTFRSIFGSSSVRPA